jgi:hypothetical protein
VSAWDNPEAKLLPKIETNEPTVTDWPFTKLAPFKTPPSATLGGCANVMQLIASNKTNT